MVGHDDVRVTGDLEVVGGDALLGEHVNLGEENLRVNDAAVADHGVGALIHDAGGNLVQRQLLSVGNDRVTSVGATGVAAHHVKVAGNEVRDLALALVSPLRTHEHRCRHVRSPRRDSHRKQHYTAGMRRRAAKRSSKGQSPA